MTSGEDYEVDFSGKHDNSVLGVANEDYEVATVANSVKNRMIDRGVIDADQLEVIYQSDTFPTTGYGTVYNLAPELQDDIKEAFFSFDWEAVSLPKSSAAMARNNSFPSASRITGPSSVRSTKPTVSSTTATESAVHQEAGGKSPASSSHAER